MIFKMRLDLKNDWKEIIENNVNKNLYTALIKSLPKNKVSNRLIKVFIATELVTAVGNDLQLVSFIRVGNLLTLSFEYEKQGIVNYKGVPEFLKLLYNCKLARKLSRSMECSGAYRDAKKGVRYSSIKELIKISEFKN